MKRLNRQPDDSLSELLRTVQVHSAVFCESELSAPWGFRVEASPSAKFHLALEGSGILTLDGGEHTAVKAGDLLLLPAGTGHILQDAGDSVTPSLDRLLAERTGGDGTRLVYGGGGTRTRLICGGYALTAQLPDRLFALLPPILKLDVGATGLARWLEPLLDVLRDETDGSGPGGAGQTAIFAKVADVLLAQALRSYLVDAEAAGPARLSLLDDPAVARAVELLRSQPQEPWTVEALARESAMSRSLFAARFRRLVGESPIGYLTTVRMSQAAVFLATTNETVYAIARRVGYESEASFSKAFKRRCRQSPSDYRRESRGAPIVVEHEPMR